jgi:SAM-dependent methyltransferase
MKKATLPGKINRVRARIPLGSSVNPYVNRLGVVRTLAYGRLQAALWLVRITGSGRVLDVGCWAGYFLPSLLREFSEVWGVDDDSASVVHTTGSYWTILQVAHNLCEAELGSLSRPALVQATGSALPFVDGHFDVVFCMDTLAHVPSRSHMCVIRELRRVTKIGGQVIFSLPVETGPIRLVKQVVRALAKKQSDATMYGYDFRVDLTLLDSCFPVCEPHFYPINALGSLNPFVIVNCEIGQGQFEDLSTKRDRLGVL